MGDSESGGPDAADVRHRMANTLQLLGALARMRSQRAGEPEARRQLLWMADVVGSLGALERQRCEGGIDFAAFLSEMAPIWRRRFGARPAEIVLEAERVVAPDHAASTLALIVQELIGNALAHGADGERPCTVRVRLARLDGERCELVVCDDGPGFDPASPATRERFGLWLVRNLAPQLRGEFTLTRAEGVEGRLVFFL